ncbi:MAG: glycosyltransferase [Gammaproteobacteria bacterium]|nr:glycosyltransferase [Gammaproteobacteria bacterium]
MPISQTFVWDELRSHDRYLAEVFAWQRRNRNLFPGAVHVASPWFPLTRRNARFDRLLAAGRHSLIHAHFGWAGVIAARFARRHTLPLVVTFHGLDVAALTTGNITPPQLWPYTLYAREMLSQLTLGLCASAELLEMLVTAGVPRASLAEHRLGIDLVQFRPGQRDDKVLRVAMVGRFVEKKGFADGLRAFARFADSHPEPTELAIVGSGPLDHELRSLCAALGQQSRVRFLGALSHQEVATVLARSDVLLAPSVVAANGDRDSGLLSAKEASASACVPIATRHGGIPSIIDDGTTGFLVNEHDVEGIVTHLRTLANHPNLRRSMAEGARAKMMREYGLRESVRNLERFYDDAIVRYKSKG